MQNPERLATKQDLSDMYTRILPYLNKSVDAGFTPVGSIIAIMGVTAPANYLACDGTVYNISDYPELANYFEQQFGTKYKFGGSGTTFGIPDLRGEFLRGTGTNSHAGNGDGAAVGVHQNATAIPEFVVSQLGTNMYFRGGASATNSFLDYDSTKTKSDIGTLKNLTVSGTAGTTGDSYSSKTVRPTNTSILWCIATKDIYLNPAMDYSTSEKVVGKWIDGKTIYQKTIDFGALPADSNGKNVSTGLLASSIDRIIHIDGFSYTQSDARNISRTLPYSYVKEATEIHVGWWTQINNNYICIYCMSSYDRSNENAYVTIQYTKTTD